MENQIVTCGGMDCSVCSVINLVNILFRYLLGISAVLTVLILIIAGFLYLQVRGKKEELSQARRTLFYALYGLVVTGVSFTVVALTFFATGSENRGEWFRINCTVVHETDSEAQEPANIEDSSYLKNTDDQIVESGNIGSIASGDKKIVKLDSSQMNTDNFASDIWGIDPERKITFFSGDKDVSGKDVIDFRNDGLGYNKSQTGKYIVQPTEQYASDQLVDPDQKLRPILSINSSDAADSFKVEWGQNLRKTNGNYTITNNQGVNKIANSLKKVAQVSELGGKKIYAYVTGDLTLVGNKVQNCTDSGGEMKEFQNLCLADKKKFENRNMVCSSIYQPVTACDCPIGYYLKDEKCQSFEDLTKQEQSGASGDRTTSKSNCKDISLEKKNCPAARCEGDRMMYYPDYVEDQCLDTLEGPQINKKFCVGTPSNNVAENKKCEDALNNMSIQQQMKEAEDFYKKNGYSPDWYEKIVEKELGKGPDFTPGKGNAGPSPMTNSTGTSAGTGTKTGTGPSKPPVTDTGTGKIPTNDDGTGTNTGKTPTDTGKTPTDTGQLPADQGAGNFNPTPSFQELKECIGLKGEQIPYNGILVVLLNPANFDRSDRYLVNAHNENISRMFYLSRNGEVIGKNGVDIGKNPTLGGQEYGARDFSKGASRDSMWGRGWKIFMGPTIYRKSSGYKEDYSFGTQEYGSKGGYKIGNYQRNDQGNLGGGAVYGLSGCGQHSGKMGSSAGCATMGNTSRRGFIEKAKSYMTKSDGTIMQIHLKGEMDPVSGKFKSPDCGIVDYCAAKRSFQNSNARKFRNDPNDGYDSGDKRRVDC